MKEKFKKFGESGFIIFLVMLLCTVFGVGDLGAMTADVVKPADGGAISVNATTSVTETRENSPNADNE